MDKKQAPKTELGGGIINPSVKQHLQKGGSEKPKPDMGGGILNPSVKQHLTKN